MSHLQKRTIILTVIVSSFMSLGACRQESMMSHSNPTGNIISNAILDSVPLRVDCRRLQNLLTDKAPYDLTLERQQDATYNAYVYRPLFGVKKGQRDIALTGLGYEWDLYTSQPLRFRRYMVIENILGKFRFHYIKENDAETVHSSLEGSYWNKATLDGEKLYCEEHNQLSANLPELEDRLYVIAVVQNPETKVLEKVTMAVKVDALLQIDGKIGILSLTNKLPFGQPPSKAPVYNRHQELVGYVMANRPGAIAGIIIASIHDPKIGPQLAKLTKQSAWKPKTLMKPAISQRFQDLICSRILNPSVRGCDNKTSLLSDLWNACRRKSNLATNGSRVP